MIQSGAHQFGSLKWIVIKRLSFLFSSTLLIIALLVYLSLEYYFDGIREMRQNQQKLQFSSMLENRMEKYAIAGQFVSSVIGYNTTSKPDIAEVENLLNSYRHFINERFEIGEISLYSPNGRLVTSWGTRMDADHFHQLHQPIVDKFMQSLTPEMQIICERTCKQHAMVGLWANFELVGLLMFGAGLGDFTTEFRDFVGSEIAMIQTSKAMKVDDSSGFLFDQYFELSIANSDYSFASASDQEVFLSAFEQLGVQPVEDKISFVEVFGKQYELSYQPAYFNDIKLPFELVFLQQIDKELALVKSFLQILFIIFGACALLTGVSLYWAINEPMNRLRLITSALPLLGKQRFSEFRQTVGEPELAKKKHELDLLHETSYQLCSKLNRLEEEIEQQTTALTTTLIERDREADFVNNLLDSAPLLVVMHCMDGRVHRINEFGRDLMGLSESSTNIEYFSNVFGSNDCVYTLNDLQRVIRTESKLATKEGNEFDVAWVHRRVQGETDEEYMILSVGLDITEQKNSQRKLSFLAEHDPLTGLFNRNKIRALISTFLEKKEFGVLCYFDLRYFKLINDTYGHKFGDMTLIQVANYLVQIFQDNAEIGRLGGDEFAVLVRNNNVENVVVKIRELNQRMQEVQIAGSFFRLPIRVSAGIVEFDDSTQSIDTLMHQADCAMYEVKSNDGEKNWHVYNGNERMLSYLQDSLDWRKRTEQALLEGNFRLKYQPIVNLESGEVSGFEVLVRMIDEESKLIVPSKFIPFSESDGSIGRIDKLVMTKALSDFPALLKLKPNIELHLNISAKSLTDPEIVALLEQHIVNHNLPASQIVIEVTETAAIKQLNLGKHYAMQMVELGCRLAIDDFGAGYGSLTYLAEFPVDKVKIDASFVRMIKDSEESTRLLSSLSQFCLGMNKTTVAEGVEHLDILHKLKEMGIDEAQGSSLLSRKTSMRFSRQIVSSTPSKMAH
ncbi:EAL domain-containing protein [Veronia nyctiphanis]|nr:EAL domain-containing protein [Veronia nyctiphanis]